jgi:hypothetical protein
MRRKAEANYDDIELAEIILAVHLTAEWEGMLENGEPLPCDYGTKSRVYKEHRWLREQVNEFARDRGNFIGSLPKHSLKR